MGYTPTKAAAVRRPPVLRARTMQSNACPVAQLQRQRQRAGTRRAHGAILETCVCGCRRCPPPAPRAAHRQGGGQSRDSSACKSLAHSNQISLHPTKPPLPQHHSRHRLICPTYTPIPPRHPPLMTDPLVPSEDGLTGAEVMAQRNAFRNSFAADKWCDHAVSRAFLFRPFGCMR